MRKLIFFVAFLWILIVFLIFLNNYFTIKKKRREIAYTTARNFFNFIVLVREWNAIQGGVYVPVSKFTPPNPYLKDPLKIIKVNDRLTLTKVNPAYMTRQLSEMAQKREGVKFRITSLNPISPKNKPTPLERQALISFEKGQKEFIKILGNKYFYMAPLRVKKPCLKCHAKQGYELGDIRGGISILIPYHDISPTNLIIGHIVFGLLGVIAIVFWGLKLEKAYDTIKDQAIHDALTGLYNRGEFERRIEEEFRRCKRYGFPLSLLMCDIDFFKNFNDIYGHREGDRCLREVARAIESCVRRGGDFCARYGGEEFVVVLPQTSLKGALKVTERIKDSVERLSIPHEGSPFGHVTVSIGLAHMEKIEDGLFPENLIKLADKALYEAKKRGRNRGETVVVLPRKVPDA